MLPLLPLTKGAEFARDRIVDDMITGLQKAGKEDVLALGNAFASLVYKTKDDEQSLKRRFAMFQEALEDSWFYKEVLQKGMQQGIEKGVEQGQMKMAQSMLMRFVKTHFPELLSLAQEQLEQSTTPEALNAKIDKLLIAKTLEEARQALQES